jgi:hypothetical protein
VRAPLGRDADRIGVSPNAIVLSKRVRESP